jgi:hypothetical protein
MGYNPGTITIDTLIIDSPLTGTWDATGNFLTCSILETIFTPGITAHIEIIDDNDMIGKMKIQGLETVSFAFTKMVDDVLGNQTAKYYFHLNSVKEITPTGSNKTKTYQLNCISKEALLGRTFNVQQAYNAPISYIVEDIFNSMPAVRSEITIEPTKGKRNIKLSSQSVFNAIEMLRKEAISDIYETSNYMFWQSMDAFHFKTLEYMVSQPPVKTLKQDFTVGQSIGKSIDDNILAWKIIQSFDAMNRVKAGVVSQRVAVFDPNTLSYRIAPFAPNPLTIMGNWTYEEFRSLMGGRNSNRNVLTYRNPSNTLNIPKSNVPANIAEKQLNLAQMQEQLLRMRLIGDPVLQAGSIVFCNIPNSVSTVPDNTYPDPQASGKWLISKVEHEIKLAVNSPRYLCNVECLKGAYSGEYK